MDFGLTFPHRTRVKRNIRYHIVQGSLFIPAQNCNLIVLYFMWSLYILCNNQALVCKYITWNSQINLTKYRNGRQRIGSWKPFITFYDIYIIWYFLYNCDLSPYCRKERCSLKHFFNKCFSHKIRVK